MKRRNFLLGLGAAVAGVAVERAIPFARVWSFPSKIRIFNAADLQAAVDSLRAATIIPYYTATISEYCDYLTLRETFIRQPDGKVVRVTTLNGKVFESEPFDWFPFAEVAPVENLLLDEENIRA